MLTVLLLFAFIQSSLSTTPDDSLPVYMRGLQWDRVQEHLKEDLRLSDDVSPLHYTIQLSAHVRGHDEVARSYFNGTVTIALNFTRATDKIELHSNGLTIEKVVLLEAVALEPPPSLTKFDMNEDRETIVIHSNRTIVAGEEFMLQISYRGVAKLNEYGLYENWDPKFNSSYDHSSPYILATNSFPTGARCWFPCFDEPHRKATFQLHLNHPKSVNVFSNTQIERTESSEESGKIISVFTKTQPLSTYQLALSINHFPIEDLGKLDGFDKVRVMSSLIDPERSINEVQLKIIRSNLEFLKNISSTLHPKGKLDIVFLDGTFQITTSPGLMFIGRYNIFRNLEIVQGKRPISNFTNLIIANQLSIRSTDQMWLNDMLALFYANEGPYPASDTKHDQLVHEIPRAALHSSIHERPLRSTIGTFTSTTTQFLRAKQQEPTIKGFQLLRAANRICPEARNAIEKYILETRGKFADLDKLVETILQFCDDSDVKEFLNDFIYQPGRAFLTVTRNNDTVTIDQMRYLSVSFDERFRDTKTRYTMPIFYRIEGREHVKFFRKNESHLSIPVKVNSTFTIDDTYDRLYHVFYRDFPKFENTTKERRRCNDELDHSVRKSLLAALEQGAINFDEFIVHFEHYLGTGVVHHTDSFLEQVKGTLSLAFGWDLIESWRHCEESEMTSWNELFNGHARYWTLKDYFRPNDYGIRFNDENMGEETFCVKEWTNSTTYTKFLEDTFLDDANIVRPLLFKYLGRRTSSGQQWKELHQFFYRNTGKSTDPLWNNLADLVVNHEGTDLPHHLIFWGKHPDPLIQDDYMTELRNFVIRNPRQAAAMSNEIEMALEKQFIRRERAKALGVDQEKFFRAKNITSMY